ncbi:MAG: hypothetical protein HUK08_06870 [Bacteroidaceae bacterium]|nr:hypothetical protein [Bacteroidaceae bacterium]
MKKIFIMIAAIAMAGTMCSCGEKKATNENADPTAVEAVDEAAAEDTVSDKPAMEQVKDAVAAVEKACADKDFAALEKGFNAYLKGLEGIKSPEDVNLLVDPAKNAEYDIEKSFGEIEKWVSEEDQKKLAPVLEKIQAACENLAQIMADDIQGDAAAETKE